MPRKPFRRESRYVSKLCVWVPDATALIEGMRYDSCYPDSEAESYKISRLASHSATAAEHVVRLTRVARTDAPPTLDRWRSFGAFVLDVRHPDDSPITDADLAHLVAINHEIAGSAS